MIAGCGHHRSSMIAAEGFAFGRSASTCAGPAVPVTLATSSNAIRDFSNIHRRSPSALPAKRMIHDIPSPTKSHEINRSRVLSSDRTALMQAFTVLARSPTIPEEINSEFDDEHHFCYRKSHDASGSWRHRALPLESIAEPTRKLSGIERYVPSLSAIAES